MSSGMPAATSFECAEAQIILWEKVSTFYQAAGGTEPTDEDKRHTLLKIIPSSFSVEMKTKANAEQTAESLREWIRVQTESIREQSGKGIHIIEQPREPLHHDDHQDDQQEKDDDT